MKKSKLICYLGAWLDATLNFKHHTNMKCHTALVNLKNDMTNQKSPGQRKL